MNLIGVISSDDKVNWKLRSQLEKNFGRQFYLHIPTGEEAMLEMLNFDMPEVVVIHFSDRNIDLEYLLEQIKEDSWLHNFGIIGIYDKNGADEKELYRRYPSINLLTLIDYGKIEPLFAPSLAIIEENRQVIFQSQLAEQLVDRAAGSFEIANGDFRMVPVYAGLVSTALNRRRLIKPEERVDLQMALSELILNGIEHGNCRISFEEKTAWMMEGREMADLIEAKGREGAGGEKVFLEWEIGREEARFVIRDEGEGFDVKALRTGLKGGGNGAAEEGLHGRGIRLALMLSDKLSYNQKGNRVTMKVKRRVPLEGAGASEPGPGAGAAGGAVGAAGGSVDVQPGEVIFQEGEYSDYIYYVSSGTYEVFAQGAQVGTITPADIFMGELSFLMSNKRSATVKAASRGRLLKISRKAFISIIKEYPHYGIILSRLIGRKLVRANERSVEQASEQESFRQEAE